MTIAQIVLASLNIIVAIAMFYLAGQSAYARAAWTAYVRGLERNRDGVQVANWSNELPVAQKDILKSRISVDANTFMALDPEVRAAALASLKGPDTDQERMKSDEGIRQEIASLFWSTGERTTVKKDGEKRSFTVIDDADARKKTPPSKLLKPDDPEVAAWAQKLGPAGFTKLVRAAIQQQYPQLELETREAGAKLYFARARLADAQAQQARVKTEVEELTKRRDVEKELLRQAEFENLEKRREITKLEADIEEALAGLTLALGREADKKRLYEEIQQKTTQTAANNEKLVDSIKGKEDK
ncbi:MAG: hypothetical protein QM703_00740 [Gemmatales bacterium]